MCTTIFTGFVQTRNDVITGPDGFWDPLDIGIELPVVRLTNTFLTCGPKHIPALDIEHGTADTSKSPSGHAVVALVVVYVIYLRLSRRPVENWSPSFNVYVLCYAMIVGATIIIEKYIDFRVSMFDLNGDDGETFGDHHYLLDMQVRDTGRTFALIRAFSEPAS